MSDEPEEIMWAGKYVTAKKKGRWEYVSRSRGIRAAVILPLLEEADGTVSVILVEQYRVPLRKNCIELPAGLIGDEDGAEDEPAVVAAARELEEETGYRAGTMIDCGEYYSSPGMVTESFSLFEARCLTKVGEGGGTESEDITVHKVALPDLQDFLAAKRAEGAAIDVRMLLLLQPGG